MHTHLEQNSDHLVIWFIMIKAIHNLGFEISCFTHYYLLP